MFDNKKLQQIVKRERKSINHYKYKLVAYLSSLILLVISLLFYMWPRMQIIKLSYHWEKLQTKKQEELKRNQMFLLEISTLRSLQRVENIAKEDLKMIEPEVGQIIIVELEQDKKP